MSIKLIWDKSECTLESGHVTIQGAPKDYPPFPVQAIVEEQDTHLLLGEQITLTDPGKPAWYLANTLEREDDIYQLGSVLLKPQQKVRLLAIVHDIEQDPTCKPEFIELAWQNIFQIIETEKLTSIALPLLGTVHGKIKLPHAFELLRTALQNNLPECLERIWFILPTGTDCTYLRQLSM